MEKLEHPILAVIGLGNPGVKYHGTRHNIGFRVVDALAQRYGGKWQEKELFDLATIQIGDKKLLLVKPQTFMNQSGKVMPFLNKKGIKAENVLVVHDELEYPFGKIKIRFGGSARGHNGLRSIIEHVGKEFARLRFGIGRPEDRKMVGNYVLQNFAEPLAEVEQLIEDSAGLIENLIQA